MSAPLQIVQRRDGLWLRWAETEAELDARQLRAACRCTQCRSAALRGELAPVEMTLHLLRVEPIGNYALRVAFSDGHERGIFPWTYLYELACAHLSCC